MEPRAARACLPMQATGLWDRHGRGVLVAAAHGGDARAAGALGVAGNFRRTTS